MRPIKKPPPWLSLREAANVVGRATCGEKWSDDLLDKPEDPRHEAMRKDLYSVFLSCDVPALFEDGVAHVEVKPEHVLDLCFTLYIPEDQISLGQVPGEKFRVKLHADKLEEFLRKMRQFRSSAAYHHGLKGECTNWLIDLMNKHERPPEGRTKEYFREEALMRFDGLSARAFDDAWKAAWREAGATGWSKGGRPKRSRKT
jgi:hypothetical protein